MSPGASKPLCLLTGASGQLGSALLRHLRTDFAVLAIYGSHEPTADSQTRRAIWPSAEATQPSKRSCDTYVVQADLTDPTSVNRLTEIALARYNRIDHVINAAADVAFYGSTLEADRLVGLWQRQMQLNCFVPLALAANVARAFWRDRPSENRRLGRSVVNISSISGLNIYPGVGQAGYSASKAALNFMTCHLAAELMAIGVRANALAPTSFPSIVAVDTVVSAVSDLLVGDATGQILLLDSNGVRSAT